jgi:hypothetical protein
MVTACAQILAIHTNFLPGIRALAVTNLCFSDTPELLQIK